MSKGIDLSDPGVWDDRALVESWDEALAEYKKYHSIHAQGKNLEEVLTTEELRQLKKERRAQRNGRQQPIEAARTDETSRRADATEVVHENLPMDNGATAYDVHNQPTPQNGPTLPITQAPIPQVLMAGVQDEALKNLMMSWYYAGYYTGYYEGQQKAKEQMNSGAQQ